MKQTQTPWHTHKLESKSCVHDALKRCTCGNQRPNESFKNPEKPNLRNTWICVPMASKKSQWSTKVLLAWVAQWGQIQAPAKLCHWTNIMVMGIKSLTILIIKSDCHKVDLIHYYQNDCEGGWKYQTSSRVADSASSINYDWQNIWPLWGNRAVLQKAGAQMQLRGRWGLSPVLLAVWSSKSLRPGQQAPQARWETYIRQYRKPRHIIEAQNNGHMWKLFFQRFYSLGDFDYIFVMKWQHLCKLHCILLKHMVFVI